MNTISITENKDPVEGLKYFVKKMLKIMGELN